MRYTLPMQPLLMAGEMAGTMANAPLPGKAVTEALKPKATDKPAKGNAIARFLGEPTFARPARAVKWATSKQNPNEQYASIGRVLFSLGTVGHLEATIYRNRVITKTAKGRQAQESIRFSLPKGVKFGAEMETEAGKWADSILDGWEKWDAENGNIGGKVQSARSGTKVLGTVDLTEDE